MVRFRCDEGLKLGIGESRCGRFRDERLGGVTASAFPVPIEGDAELLLSVSREVVEGAEDIGESLFGDWDFPNFRAAYECNNSFA